MGSDSIVGVGDWSGPRSLNERGAAVWKRYVTEALAGEFEGSAVGRGRMLIDPGGVGAVVPWPRLSSGVYAPGHRLSPLRRHQCVN